jgi:hypothetical protein
MLNWDIPSDVSCVRVVASEYVRVGVIADLLGQECLLDRSHRGILDCRRPGWICV